MLFTWRLLERFPLLLEQMLPDLLHRRLPGRAIEMLALRTFKNKPVIPCPSSFKRSKRIQQTVPLRKALITQRCGCILTLILKQEIKNYTLLRKKRQGHTKLPRSIWAIVNLYTIKYDLTTKKLKNAQWKIWPFCYTFTLLLREGHCEGIRSVPFFICSALVPV